MRMEFQKNEHKGKSGKSSFARRCLKRHLQGVPSTAEEGARTRLMQSAKDDVLSHTGTQLLSKSCRIYYIHVYS